MWCNNCAKYGHTFNQCKIPITSFGCIVFRINRETGNREYLMICRRFSISFLEFIRGKYNLMDRDNIIYLLQQMTNTERELISSKDFNKIWGTIWEDRINTNNTNEEIVLSDKFNLLCNGINKYNLDILIEDCLIPPSPASNHELLLYPLSGWDEPEWGFPKGRREFKEMDYNCAIREFQEETGIPPRLLYHIKNIIPIEENFMGSNYKTYKHKYYLMYMNYDDTLLDYTIQHNEVSELSWKTIDDCIKSIRPYNFEKKNIITNIDNCLNSFVFYS